MKPQYAPGLLGKIGRYKADLDNRVQAGALTINEASILYRRFVTDFMDTKPDKKASVVCSECQKTTSVIGQPGYWVCGCSPDKQISLIDQSSGI